MSLSERLKESIRSCAATKTTVRTCGVCRRETVDPLILDRDGASGKVIWRCRRCRSRNVGNSRGDVEE